MRKGLKIALDQKQIDQKNTYDIIDCDEIHLFGDERDHFEFADQLAKPVATIHYPLDRCDIAIACEEYDSPYMARVVELARKTGAGIVLHAESSAGDIFSNPHFPGFCDFLRENRIRVHVENCYRTIGAVEALNIMRYMKKRIGDDLVFPLLDTCHLMMSEMSFKYEELSFSQAIDAFKSECFRMHCNDCIGSGEKETGGIHGTNFSRNLYLLNNILWKLYNLEKEGYRVDLILEIDEEDYISVPDAMKLAENIDYFWNDYIRQETEGHPGN